MSYFNDHFDPGKFHSNDLFSQNSFAWTTPKPPTKPGPPFWVFGVVVAVYILYEILKKVCCKKEQNASDATTVFSNNYNQQMPRTLPVATIISERSPSSNYTFNPRTARPPTQITPTAPQVEHQLPQVFQQTAPRIDEDNTPKYDSPPNYDEAMKFLNQEKDKNSPIT